MYALNSEVLKSAAKVRGFDSLAAVLKKLGLHRNTLSRFLRGSPVLPLSISKILIELELSPAKALVRKDQLSTETNPISPLVRKIHGTFPQISIFLFGSRSRGSARKYSDFDIGIYCEAGFSLEQYLKIIAIKEEFEDDSRYYVDCLNLNSADKSFLHNISPDLQLLAGYQSDLIKLRSIAQ